MKILMISDFYPPTIGGMEREVQLLSEGLVERGCQVVVCTIRHKSLPRFSEENGVKVYGLEGLFQKILLLFKDPERRYHPPVTDWLITNRLKEIIEKEKPDVIHTHGWILYSSLPLRRKLDIPLCVTFHDFGFICPVRWSPIHFKGICNDPLTNKCLDCGRESYGLIKSFFVYHGVKSNKIFQCNAVIYTNPNIVEEMGHLKQNKFYLPHPIDTDDYRPIEIEQYKNKILCWVKLQRFKGIDVIFEVAKKLPRYQFDIPFVGGDKELYKKNKPKNVKFIPRQKNNEIPRLINKYPIVLGQFHIGVLGLSELEAMSCGKPVIAYWDTQYNSLYEEPCPILTSKEVKRIAKLIEHNIGNKSIGKLSREWILKNHSESKVIDKLINIYKYALKEH